MLLPIIILVVISIIHLLSLLLTLIHEVLERIYVVLAPLEPRIVVSPTLNHKYLFEWGHDGGIVQSLAVRGWHDLVLGASHEEHGDLDFGDSLDGGPVHP